MKKYSISIIIPAAKDESFQNSLQAVRNLDYDKKKMEVIVVRGNQPSLQRNLSALKAKNEILYFLDNDSEPAAQNLNILNDFFRQNKQAVIMGGPSLSKKEDTVFQKAEGSAFGSFIGSLFSRSRYTGIGELRESNELELILCNLAVKRKEFLVLKGFNISLYPNEENEFINRVQRKKKKTVYYHPGFAVYRSHRKNIPLLVKQIFTYGRGRAEQVCVSIKDLTLFPLVSLGIAGYLLTLPLYSFSLRFLPLLAYGVMILGVTLYKMIRNKHILFLFFLPVIYFIMHTMYGVGFLYGVIKHFFYKRKREKKFWYKIQWIKKI